MISRRSALAAIRFTSAPTASAMAASVVTRTQAAFGSCSAWARISAAMKVGFAVPSARIAISLGPAGKSISASSRSSIFAAVT